MLLLSPFKREFVFSVTFVNDTTFYIENIPIINQDIVTGEYIFSLDNLFLAPDDEVHLKIIV